PLTVSKAIEIGHIFKLGRKYSHALGVSVQDEAGSAAEPIMGSYGIGIERILVAAIEQNCDKNGFWLPRSIAPYSVIVTPTNLGDAAIAAASERVVAALTAQGEDVLFDDRDERAGVKFKDADLIGIPRRITVGKKAAQGIVEEVDRATGAMREVDIASLAA